MERTLSRTAAALIKPTSRAGFAICIIAFLLGRAVLFDIIAPFGLAFLSAYVDKHPTRGLQSIAIGGIALLGLWSAGVSLWFVKYVLAYILFGLLYLGITSLVQIKNPYVVPGIAAASLGTAGFIFVAQMGFIPYDLLMLAVESAVCFLFAFVLHRAIPILCAPSVTRPFRGEEMTAFYVMVVVCILGFSGWNVGTISLGSSLSALFIMTAAMLGGMAAGATAGLGVGVISTFALLPMTEMLGIYGFCGLMAGVLSRYKRVGVLVGFVGANILFSLYLGEIGGAFSVLELAVAGILFCLVPKSFFLSMDALFSQSGLEGGGTAQKSVDLLTQRMQGVSLSFAKLAAVFSQMVRPEPTQTKQQITALYDEVAHQVCSRCLMRFTCWERQYATTHAALSKATPLLMEAGSLEMGDMPPEFCNQCIKPKDFVKELNNAYGRQRLNALSQQQIQQGYRLVNEHLRSVAGMMSRLTQELDGHTQFESSLEDQLTIELEGQGFKCGTVSVMKNSEGRLEATIRLRGCGGSACEHIAALATHALGRPMCKRDGECTTDQTAARCSIRLIEREQFAVQCGSACRAKGEESGDSFSYRPVGNGKYAVILSDGMGSGSNAAQKSNTSIELMHYLLQAGFDKHAAVKILNASLLLKSEDECFATLDIALFDLFTGVGEFIKIGANTGYIKRGNQVDKIQSHTLPAGILQQVDMEPQVRQLKEGDWVILLSDGVQDPRENWLEPFLKRLEPLGPQQMSRAILEEATRLGGKRDDMTVITAAIRKTAAPLEERKGA